MQVIIEGQYELTSTYAKRWALPGTFPRRYWDVVTADDEEELTAYLSGQQPFIRHDEQINEVKADNRPTPLSFAQDTSNAHVCARCKKPCKQPYKHCYRCNAYLKVKEKIR